MKHKHIYTPKAYIQQFLGAKVIPNGTYGKLVSVCRLCGKVKEQAEKTDI